MTRLCHLPRLENFTFYLLHLYLAFFLSVRVHKYIKYSLWAYLIWADFDMCRVFLASCLVYLSNLTLVFSV